MLNNYRDYLMREYIKRKELNPKFTLSAYSQFIGLKASILNDVLKGRHGISLVLAKKISQKLNLSKIEKELFCLMVESEHARSKINRKKALALINKKKKNIDYKSIDLEKFKIIGHWFYLTLLELIETKDFKSDLNWISKKIGVSKSQVEYGLKALKKLDLIHISQGSQIKAKTHKSSLYSNVPSEVIRHFHKNLSLKGLKQLDSVNFKEREFQSVILSFSSNEIDKAKEMISQFLIEFTNEFGNSNDKDSVYGMCLQFFPLIGESQ